MTSYTVDTVYAELAKKSLQSLLDESPVDPLALTSALGITVIFKSGLDDTEQPRAKAYCTAGTLGRSISLNKDRLSNKMVLNQTVAHCIGLIGQFELTAYPNQGMNYAITEDSLDFHKSYWNLDHSMAGFFARSLLIQSKHLPANLKKEAKAIYGNGLSQTSEETLNAWIAELAKNFNVFSAVMHRRLVESRILEE